MTKPKTTKAEGLRTAQTAPKKTAKPASRPSDRRLHRSRSAAGTRYPSTPRIIAMLRIAYGCNDRCDS